MNSRFCTILMGALLLGMAGELSGQTLVRMPNTGTWRIDIRRESAKETKTQSAPNTQTPPPPPSMTTTHLGDLVSIEVAVGDVNRRDTLTWADRTVEEYWRINGHWIFRDSSGELTPLAIFGGMDLGGRWKAFSPTELQSYTKGATVSDGQYKSRTARIYEKQHAVTGPVESSGQEPKTTVLVDSRLWVDPETLYPIALVEQGVLYTFTFLNSAPMVLTPPKEYAETLDRFLELSRSPSPIPKKTRIRSTP